MIPFVLLAAGSYLALPRAALLPAEKDTVPEPHSEIMVLLDDGPI
jgi:hypothetical protein